jgi:hypothetical protein
LTLRDCNRASVKGLVRSSPSVRGRLMKTPGRTNTFFDYTREEKESLADGR